MLKFLKFFSYAFVVSSPKAEVSISVPTISALIIVVATAGSIWFFSESLTVRKALGIIALIVGIIFLRPGQQKPPEQVSGSQATVIEK